MNREEFILLKEFSVGEYGFSLAADQGGKREDLTKELSPIVSIAG